MTAAQTYTLVALPGDGIGPEVTRQAVRVLNAVADASGFSLLWTTHLLGGAAVDATGDPLPASTLAACRQADAVLIGAVGGPSWDHLGGAQRPEAGLLRLRKALDVYANLRPVAVSDALAASAPLRPHLLDGVDLLVVRELTGGIYFGQPRGEIDGEAFDTMRYRDEEIERVAHVAFAWAERRSGRVTSVDKANVLAVSRRWRQVVTALHQAQYAHLKLDHLYVDNAAMQLVRDPRSFDVILTGNLFGDILSDLAAALPGSLGMLPSASVGGQVGVFEPVHGSAPDLAGRGEANPLAAILSGAMLLDTLDQPAAAAAIRQAVALVLDAGLRTADLWQPGHQLIDTETMGARVAEHAAAGAAAPAQPTASSHTTS